MSAPAGNPPGDSVPRRFAPDAEQRLAEIQERTKDDDLTCPTAMYSVECQAHGGYVGSVCGEVVEQLRQDRAYLLDLVDRADMEHDALRLIAEQGRPDGGAA